MWSDLRSPGDGGWKVLETDRDDGCLDGYVLDCLGRCDVGRRISCSALHGCWEELGSWEACDSQTDQISGGPVSGTVTITDGKRKRDGGEERALGAPPRRVLTASELCGWKTVCGSLLFVLEMRQGVSVLLGRFGLVEILT